MNRLKMFLPEVVSFLAGLAALGISQLLVLAMLNAPHEHLSFYLTIFQPMRILLIFLAALLGAYFYSTAKRPSMYGHLTMSALAFFAFTLFSTMRQWQFGFVLPSFLSPLYLWQIGRFLLPAIPVCVIYHLLSAKRLRQNTPQESEAAANDTGKQPPAVIWLKRALPEIASFFALLASWGGIHLTVVFVDTFMNTILSNGFMIALAVSALTAYVYYRLKRPAMWSYLVIQIAVPVLIAILALSSYHPFVLMLLGAVMVSLWVPALIVCCVYRSLFSKQFESPAEGSEQP